MCWFLVLFQLVLCISSVCLSVCIVLCMFFGIVVCEVMCVLWWVCFIIVFIVLWFFLIKVWFLLVIVQFLCLLVFGCIVVWLIFFSMVRVGQIVFGLGEYWLLNIFLMMWISLQLWCGCCLISVSSSRCRLLWLNMCLLLFWCLLLCRLFILFSVLLWLLLNGFLCQLWWFVLRVLWCW